MSCSEGSRVSAGMGGRLWEPPQLPHLASLVFSQPLTLIHTPLLASVCLKLE